MLSSTRDPMGGGTVVPQSRGTFPPGGCGASGWDFVPSGPFGLKAHEPCQLVDKHQTSLVQVKPFLLISKM